MNRYRTACGDLCLEFRHYHHAPVKLTADPYNSEPEYTDYGKDWECPDLEDCGGPDGLTCEDCDAECDDRIDCGNCPEERCGAYGPAVCGGEET